MGWKQWGCCQGLRPNGYEYDENLERSWFSCVMMDETSCKLMLFGQHTLLVFWRLDLAGSAGMLFMP